MITRIVKAEDVLKLAKDNPWVCRLHRCSFHPKNGGCPQCLKEGVFVPPMVIIGGNQRDNIQPAPSIPYNPGSPYTPYPGQGSGDQWPLPTVTWTSSTGSSMSYSNETNLLTGGHHE